MNAIFIIRLRKVCKETCKTIKWVYVYRYRPMIHARCHIASCTVLLHSVSQGGPGKVTLIARSPRILGKPRWGPGSAFKNRGEGGLRLLLITIFSRSSCSSLLISAHSAHSSQALWIAAWMFARKGLVCRWMSSCTTSCPDDGCLLSARSASV